MKRNIKLYRSWLLTVLGMAVIVFSSCIEDEELDNRIAATHISLDTSSLTLAVGEDYILIATVMPDNATDPVTWTSADTSMVIVVDGKVIAKAAGEVEITAQAGNPTAVCIITVYDPLALDDGVEINGVIWATRNVNAPGSFAANPENTGMFYQWNRKMAWTAGTITDWNNSLPVGDTWEKINDPSPAGWRVPTYEEQQKLFDKTKVTFQWTTENNINGAKFTDKTTGNSIFLPAAGYRYYYDGTLLYVGTSARYWNSMQYSNNLAFAYRMDFNSSSIGGGYANRAYGFNIRSVAE